MSTEEEKSSLCQRCIAVYKFPDGVKEQDVLSAFTEAIKANFVPDPSSRFGDVETESSESKWIVLFPNTSSPMKYLSAGFIEWKDVQLQIKQVSIPCEIPCEWMKERSDVTDIDQVSQPHFQSHPTSAGFSGTAVPEYSLAEDFSRMPVPGLPSVEGVPRMPVPGYPQEGFPQMSGYPQGEGFRQMSGYPQGEGFPLMSGYPQGGFPQLPMPDHSTFAQWMFLYRMFQSGASAIPPGGASGNQEQTEKKELEPNFPFHYGHWMPSFDPAQQKGDMPGNSLLPPSYEMSERQASVTSKEDHKDSHSQHDNALPASTASTPLEGVSAETKTIKVTNIPKDTTEDALTYFFENRRKSGGGPTEEVDYDESTQTAFITFEEANAVQRIMSKLPLLFNNKQITIEEFKPETESEALETEQAIADSFKVGCTIEVREFKDTTSIDTIEMYFENARRSGGGDVIKVDKSEEDGVVYLEFENEEVVGRILRKSHKIDGVTVNVKKYIPPPPPKPVPTYPNKVIIHNISSNTSRDGLENFLEAKVDVIPVDITYDDDQSTALVTFEEQIDFEKLKFACQKRSLDKCFLKVDKVAISSSVMVKGFSCKTSRDTMEFYFDNKKRSGGEGVLDVCLDTDDGVCIVSFEDPHVAEAVCARKHVVDGNTLEVKIFYDCLGKIVEENESADFTFPEPLLINDAIPKKVQFLLKSEQNKMALDKTLESCNGKVDWPKTSEEAKSQPFKVMCTLTTEVKDYKRLAKKWSKIVTSEVTKYLNMLVIETHSTVQEAWKQVLEELKTLNVSKPDGVAVILEKADYEINVVGHKPVVEDVSKQVLAIIKKVGEEMDRRKLKVEEKTSIKHYQVLLLQALSFGESIVKQFQELKVSFNASKHLILFDGFSTDIINAKMKMFEILNSVSKSDVGQFSPARSEFLKSSGVKKYVRDKFKENNVVAVWEINNDNTVVVYSTSDPESVKASHVVKDSVLESSVAIDRESVPLFSSQIWEKESAEQIQTFKGMVKFIPHTEQLEIVILSVDSTHGLLREFVEQFVQERTIYEQSLELSPGIMRFLRNHCQKDTNSIVKSLNSDQVRIDVTQSAISIQGTKIGLNKAKRKIDDLVQTIETKKHSIRKAGIGKHLQSSQGQERITKIENSESVVIELSDDSDQPEDGKSPRIHTTPKRKELAVCVAPRAQKIIAMVCDMTIAEVDVIVNAANKSLKHDGGLAKVIVDKGGMLIQEECDNYVRKHKNLMEGEVFTSSPGSLPCKIIVHAVGPVWTRGQNNEEEYLREAILKSLEEGSKRELKSIAIPALCTGVFGYPVREATRVIAEAVRDFFKESQDSSIDTVYLCDVKEDTVNHFVEALKRSFGPDSVTDKRRAMVDRSGWQTSANIDTSHKRERNSGIVSAGGGSINIQIIKGQIARQQVDVIVNTTSRDLKLNNGAVSNSLLTLGGNSLQQECSRNYPQGVKHGEVAVTQGGNLNCQFVCHGCLPSWNSSGSSVKALHQFMKNCLEVGHKKRLQSIAFPALGTGNLGYPKDVVAREMFTAVYKFTGNNSSTSICDVRFVLYDKDHGTIKAFESEERRQGSGGGGRHNRQFGEGITGEGGARPKTGTNNYGQTDDSQQMELDIGCITLKVYKGDITTATVEAIVNGTNPEFDLNRGKVSQYLQEKGGNDLRQQVELHKKDMKKYGIAVTICVNNNKLECDAIVHVDVETDTRNMKEKIVKAIHAADSLDKKSLGFPALGQAFGVKTGDLAKDFFKAITEEESKVDSLREIHVVLFQKEMLFPFMDSIKKSCEKYKPGYFDRFLKWTGLGKKIDVSWDKVRTIPVNNLSVTLILYGKNGVDIDNAIRKLEGGIEECFKTKLFEESVIKRFNKEQEEELKHLESNYGVEVKVEKRIGRIRLEGLTEDLMKASDTIYKMIRAADNLRQEEAEMEMLANMVEWCFIDITADGQKLEKYPPNINRVLEKAFLHQKAEASFRDDQDNEYVVDFGTYEEYPKTDVTDRVKVIRKSKLDGSGSEVPAHWSVMDDKENVSLVTLQQTDQEYQDVEREFTNSTGQGTFNLVKVERVQNKMLFHQYSAKKKLLEKQNPPQVQNEQILWHGTASDAVASINMYGFNRSYCGKNATAYGNGVYFAVNAQYSASDTYSPRDRTSQKRMYMCKVLTGEYTNAKHGMKVPPSKSGSSHILYDSVVDNPQRPGIFVIFNDTQAYPEYLITFT